MRLFYPVAVLLEGLSGLSQGGMALFRLGCLGRLSYRLFS